MTLREAAEALVAAHDRGGFQSGAPIEALRAALAQPPEPKPEFYCGCETHRIGSAAKANWDEDGCCQMCGVDVDPWTIRALQAEARSPERGEEARDYYARRGDAAECRIRTIRFIAESWLRDHPQQTGYTAEAQLVAIIGECAATEAGRLDDAAHQPDLCEPASVGAWTVSHGAGGGPHRPASPPEEKAPPALLTTHPFEPGIYNSASGLCHCGFPASAHATAAASPPAKESSHDPR